MRRVLATLSIIPALLFAIVVWVISLPYFLWQVPKDVFYRVLLNAIVVKAKKNEDGTYTILYHGREKTISEEEFLKRFKSIDDKK